MSERPEIIHADRVCVYFEDENEWRCGNHLRASTLKALKTKIDKLDADERRVAGVKALKFERSAWRGSLKVEAMEITLVKKPREGSRLDEPVVLVKKTEEHKSRHFKTVSIVETRSEEKLHELALDTPETREQLTEIAKLFDQHNALRKTIEERLKALPSMSLADLKPGEATVIEANGDLEASPKA